MLNPKRRRLGWIGIAAMLLGYLGLYFVNYRLPLEGINYTSRIWNWTQAALTILACAVLVLRRRSLDRRAVGLGLALAILSMLSHWLHDPSLSWALQEGVAVWVCFVAGAALFENRDRITVSAFQPPLAHVGQSLVWGILFAIPLAVLNNLYFYLNAGSFDFQNVFASAFEALSPAIHEEIIFRYFVLAISLNLLHGITSPRRALAIAVFLAVAPHSLNHLPELFLENPAMGLFMLAATSLLFGLPMAVLQIKRNLETAIAFHWFIDFARFLFGF